MTSAAVPRPLGDRKREPGIVTPAASIRKQEKNVIITNLIIVELTNGRVRLHIGLCHGENSLRGEDKQTDTSSRSSPSSLCPLDRPDSPSLFCRIQRRRQHESFSDVMIESYGVGLGWFVVVAIQCRRLFVLLCLSRYLQSSSMWGLSIMRGP